MEGGGFFCANTQTNGNGNFMTNSAQWGRVSENRDEAMRIDRARRYWKTMADTNVNVFNLTRFD